MMNNYIKKLKTMFKYSEILMRELEEERDESLENLRFEGEEEILIQYYKKILMSVYRMRNNTAALLLKHEFGCTETADQICIMINGVRCEIPKQALKNILQKDFDSLIAANQNTIAANQNTITAKQDAIDTNQNTITAKQDAIDTKQDAIDTKQDAIAEDQKVVAEEQNRIAENQNKIAITQSKKNLNGFIPTNRASKNQDSKRIREERKKETIKTTSSNQDSKRQRIENAAAVDKNLKVEKTKRNKEPLLDDTNLLDIDFFNDTDSTEEFISRKENSNRNESDMGLKGTVTEIPKKEENNSIHDIQKIPKDESSFDNFSFFDDFESEKTDIKKDGKQLLEPIQDECPKPRRDVALNTENDLNIDFGFFEEKPEQSIPFPKKEEKNTHPPLERKVTKSQKNPFRDNLSFFPDEETTEIQKEDIKPKFVTEVSSDKPDEIIEQLRRRRVEYDKKQIEQKILDEQQNTPTDGTLFDLSTGSLTKGELDAKEAAEKIERVADSLVEVSRKDKLLDIQVDTELSPGQYTYRIQRETDYERIADQFVLDMYKLNITVIADDGSHIKEDQVKLIVAPIDIPESGTKLVTDICAYLESDGEQQGTVVLPGGKTTITIRCEDYAVFIRGSWDSGKFTSNISVVGSGNKAEYEMDKKEIRPLTMENIGIGHNILILDHATTVHIIPIGFKNTDYGYAEFMGVVVKDYGIDKDAECYIVKDSGNIQVKGERYKFSISAIWEDRKFIIDSRIER